MGYFNVFILKKYITMYGSLYCCHGNVKIRWRRPLASIQLTERERKWICLLANSTDWAEFIGSDIVLLGSSQATLYANLVKLSSLAIVIHNIFTTYLILFHLNLTICCCNDHNFGSKLCEIVAETFRL